LAAEVVKRQAVAVDNEGRIIASGEFDTDDIIENADGSYTITISRAEEDGPISAVKMTGPWAVTDE
jgi:hypothetical protein